MLRTKTISTISTITYSSLKSLRNRDSLFHNTNKKHDSNSKNNRNSRNRGSIKKKQKRNVEQSVNLGDVYLIVHLCSNEVVKRGLLEPDIFSPVRFKSEITKVWHLIDSLLKDNRTEFENELKFQSIHNVIVGIRMALRNCVSNIVSYENYKEFVKHEREWQYDPKNGSFNHFLSRLPCISKGILIELFDLFAMTMENSHVNQMHPTRIIKSMSLHIFNESKTKKYKNFQLVYKDWLKYSNATIHLFLSYIREREYSTKKEFPERLNLLLYDYVESREQCFMRSSVSENGKEIIFSEHILPDITKEDLDEAAQIFKQSNFIINDDYDDTNLQLHNTKINFASKSGRSPLCESFPTLKRRESLESSTSTFDDPENVEAKWDELRNKGLNILSEEVLKLLFDYDDIVSIDFNGGKKKRNQKSKKIDFRISEPILPFFRAGIVDDDNDSLNNVNYEHSDKNDSDTINDEWDNFSKKGFQDSVNLDSVIRPSLSDIGSNSKIIKTSTTSNEVKEKKNRKLRKISSLLCFRCSYTDEQEEDHIYEDQKDWKVIDRFTENSQLLIETIDALLPYAWVETIIEGDERLDEWVLIEPRSNLAYESDWVIIEHKDKFFYREKSLDSTDNTKSSNCVPSLSSVYTPSILSSSQQQFNYDTDDDITKPQEPYFECLATSTERMVELYKDDDYYQEKESQLCQIQRQKFYSKQDDYFNYESPFSYSSRGRRQSIQSSTMSDSSILSAYGNIVRGKDLPYPITPIGRQSLIRRQLGQHTESMQVPRINVYEIEETAVQCEDVNNNYETINIYSSSYQS